jgi:hypothetical protein
MKLTGKCKKEFEKWFRRINIKNNWLLNSFYKLPQSMQYGVFVDFFDSVGIHIQLTPYFDSVTKVMLWFFTLENKRCVHLNSHLENKAKTRPEARTKAIDKANKLLNEQLNK